MKLPIFSATALTVAALGLPGSYALANPATAAKGLTMRAPFEIKLATVKPSYKIDEPIQVKYRSNKAGYVYVFFEDNDDVTQLLPNQRQPVARVVANEEVALFGADVTADKAGEERLIVVSSTMPLPWDDAKFIAAGNFRRGSAVEFQRQLKAFELRTGAAGESAAEEVKVNRLTIKINDKRDTLVAAISAQLNGLAAPAAIPAAAPASRIAFIATDRRSYREGEAISMLYGADTDGFVHLFVAEPGGTVQAIGKRRVKAGALNKLSARATGPAGRNVLVAAWSADGKFDDSRFAGQLKDDQVKGLVVTETPAESATPFNVSYFDVSQ